jgi:glycosyltransferase involved in cell wall biosynthesis
LIRRREFRKVASVNTSDRGSGAEQVAWTLFKGFERRGLESWLVVGDKKTKDPHVLPFFLSPHVDYRPYADPRLRNDLREDRLRDVEQGIEDFHYPYTKHLPAMTGSQPDVFLFHNLHGPYFDLRELAGLSAKTPSFLVLHDCWTMTGHCAYPVNCTRWQMGCGHCPDLSLPPSIQKDASGINWARKRSIYEGSHLFVAAPSRWLLDRARCSILAPAIRENRVIPCPVNVQLFRPAPQDWARRELGLPRDAHVLLFAAHRTRTNPYKDMATIERAVHSLACRMPDKQIVFIGLGEEGPEQQAGNTRLRFLPFQSRDNVARYLQAADLYEMCSPKGPQCLVTICEPILPRRSGIVDDRRLGLPVFSVHFK